MKKRKYTNNYEEAFGVGLVIIFIGLIFLIKWINNHLKEIFIWSVVILLVIIFSYFGYKYYRKRNPPWGIN